MNSVRSESIACAGPLFATADPGRSRRTNGISAIRRGIVNLSCLLRFWRDTETKSEFSQNDEHSSGTKATARMPQDQERANLRPLVSGTCLGSRKRIVSPWCRQMTQTYSVIWIPAETHCTTEILSHRYNNLRGYGMRAASGVGGMTVA